MRRSERLVELKQTPSASRKEVPRLSAPLTIHRGTITAIVGENGSGKSRLGRYLAGLELPRGWERYELPGLRTELVSFDAAMDLVRSERRRDESDIHGGAPDLGRTLGTLLGGGGEERGTVRRNELLRRFGIEDLLDRGVRAFSSGELRKSLLVRALLHRPELLILDDPYDGLDLDSRNALAELLDDYPRHGNLVIISGRKRDIPEGADTFVRLTRRPEGCDEPKTRRVSVEGATLPSEVGDSPPDDPLIEMNEVSLRYGEKPVLTRISWRVAAGEAWQLSGPNGAGKTSLLEIISGDNTRGYGQDLRLFGRRKGSGESIWEIKAKIGHVSAAMQGRLSSRTRLDELILSGFFDSLDLYDTPTPLQRERARYHAAEMGIEGYLERPLSELSFGIQRVGLITRALVKGPRLVLLDEPCQGLDDENAALVLAAAERLVRGHSAALIYISHDPELRIRGIRRLLKLTPHPDGGYTATIEHVGEDSDVQKTV